MFIEPTPRFGQFGPSTLTRQERIALTALRNRHRNESEFFTDRQLAYLSFVRWLYSTGRFAADASVQPTTSVDTRVS